MNPEFANSFEPGAGDPALAIELTLLETRGPFFKVGAPTLLCRFSAVHLGGNQINDGKVCVIVRDTIANHWREYARDVTADQVQQVAGRLQGLHIPYRTPNVQGVIDTSDAWTHLLLYIRAEQRTLPLEIHMHSSGFDGEDAEPLRTLFRLLFALAGYDGFCRVVYGRGA
jgi:hypothetical protein